MSTSVAPAGREEVLAAIETQIGWCRTLGSPFTAGILELVRDNVAAGGALAALVVPWPGALLADALALRLAAAFHALVRAGRAPALAAFYPASSSVPWDADAAADALAAATLANRDFVGDFIASPPQTNEVGRSAILMPGYAEVARLTGLPLRVLEIGASAGLNLSWDHYGYRLGTLAVGATDAALTLTAEWRGPLPTIARLPQVAERRGCDRAPIDLEKPGAVERLIAYVWPDQSERLQRLEAAIGVARTVAPRVDTADAADWLEYQLAVAAPGMATVVAHTIVWQYLPRPTAVRARRALEHAGAQATAERPLAWLAFEHRRADAPPVLTLTSWPGGTSRALAHAHPHGAWIEWLGG